LSDQRFGSRGFLVEGRELLKYFELCFNKMAKVGRWRSLRTAECLMNQGARMIFLMVLAYFVFRALSLGPVLNAQVGAAYSNIARDVL
jgi:hypothetical protein